MERQKTSNSHTILKKNKVRGLTLCVFKTLTNQDNMVLVKELTDNGKECNPKTDQYKHSQLVFDKGTKIVKWREDHLSSKWCWEQLDSYMQKMNLNTDLTPFTNNNSNGS